MIISSICPSSMWTGERDEAFFRIVQDLFPAAFVAAAGVLLATYDDVQRTPSGSRRTDVRSSARQP